MLLCTVTGRSSGRITLSSPAATLAVICRGCGPNSTWLRSSVSCPPDSRYSGWTASRACGRTTWSPESPVTDTLLTRLAPPITGTSRSPSRISHQARPQRLPTCRQRPITVRTRAIPRVGVRWIAPRLSRALATPAASSAAATVSQPSIERGRGGAGSATVPAGALQLQPAAGELQSPEGAPQPPGCAPVPVPVAEAACACSPSGLWPVGGGAGASGGHCPCPCPCGGHCPCWEPPPGGGSGRPGGGGGGGAAGLVTPPGRSWDISTRPSAISTSATTTVPRANGPISISPARTSAPTAIKLFIPPCRRTDTPGTSPWRGTPRADGATPVGTPP